jgi:hypothetical protein
MAPSDWQLGDGSVTAYHSGSKLLIVVEGKKPTPCHEIDIDVVPTFVPPSQYALRWRQPGPCAEVVTPYAYFELFDAPYHTQIEVHTSKGIQTIAVKPAGARTLTKASGLVGGAPATPGVAALVPTAGGVRLRGTGRSQTFSFEEALGAAIKDLEQKTGGPRNFFSCRVVEIGWQQGGFVGAHDLVVAVE